MPNVEIVAENTGERRRGNAAVAITTSWRAFIHAVRKTQLDMDRHTKYAIADVFGYSLN